MKMTGIVAFKNMKYHKSTNLLIGVAIVLTTLLLFIVPTVGNNIISVQHEATNRLYPTWHALYRNVDEKTAKKLAAHYDIATYGLRSDLGVMKLEDAKVSMIYMDEESIGMYKAWLLKGRFPEKENEIVVSEGIMEALKETGDIGDTITVPYQVYRNGVLDYAQEKEFVICGFLEDNESNREQKTYMSLISLDFIRDEIPAEEISYRFLFQIRDLNMSRMDQVEGAIRNLAEQFGIKEYHININEDYLSANYVDPSTVPAIAGIMLIIVIAGIITIYSIYYVSMNQRIQEFGRLGAIGATRRQIRQIVLKEGLCVSALAMPVGLVIGSVLSKLSLKILIDHSFLEDTFIQTVSDIIREGEVPLYRPWIYAMVIVVVLCTVTVSLMKPMRMAEKISQTEAIRYHGPAEKKKSRKKGYDYLTILRLTKRNLSDSKKKSIATILSMAATGTLLMVVATILSCADPVECTNSLIVGKYEIWIDHEENNKEYPEKSWKYIQQHNPLTDELKNKIEELDKVERVDAFSTVMVTSNSFEEGDVDSINGVPEEYAKELEKGIIRGNVTYEQLKSGDKVIMASEMLHWYPELDVGSKIMLTIYDGDKSYEKEIEIAAIGDYGHGLVQYRYLIMAKEAVDRLCENNSTESFKVIADENYDPALEQSIRELIKENEQLNLRTWKNEYEIYVKNIAIVSGVCYLFLGILAIISTMNLINTMINSVHVRKKELGMMQAIGMTDRQLFRMLQLEGFFYTAGTLFFSVVFGGIIGYVTFLYAKEGRMFEIRSYHYPYTVTVIVALTLLLIQVILSLAISKSVKREPLIERIRFSD